MQTTTPKTTRRYNVPPPSSEDTVAYKQYASRQSPPSSFFELQQDCLSSVQAALRDGIKLMEVEFPPLPASVLDLDDVSAYDVAQANLRLALDFAKGMVARSSSDEGIRSVAIMFPDESEARIAMEKATGSQNVRDPVVTLSPGVSVSSLRRSEVGDDRFLKVRTTTGKGTPPGCEQERTSRYTHKSLCLCLFPHLQPEQTFLNLFGGGSARRDIRPINGTDMYVCLVASAQELPDIEALHLAVPDTPIVLYNLKLDVLRGDLGAPAFPPKQFQDRFLSRVKPVYYLRTRQYSRSTPTPPFLVNYQGCLFRAYPGQYQTLLDTGTGSYRRLLGRDVRPALGEFKEQLTQALRDEGVLPQSEGSAFDFLRVGYKTTTWWEEDRDGASDEWRT
jgi:hypothetical protein